MPILRCRPGAFVNIEEIAARHQRCTEPHYSFPALAETPHCATHEPNGVPWPCDAAQLLDFAGKLAETLWELVDDGWTGPGSHNNRAFAMFADPNTQALLKRKEAKDGI